MITFSQETRTFYLETCCTSYVIRILQDGTVAHSYYGAKIPQEDLSYYNLFRPINFSARMSQSPEGISPESLLMEYPTFGQGDYRLPAVVVQGADGTDVNQLRYVSHRIHSGKPLMDGMPQLDVSTDQAQTLELLLRDPVTGYEVSLYYTPIDTCDVIARRTVIRSIAEVPIRIRSACSASFDIETSDFDMITLQGSWARERHVERTPLRHGISAVGSRRGASSHQLNPFAALAEKSATEDSGRVFGISLIYSGDFKLSVEVDHFDMTRVQIGLNPETFCWQLAPGETFQTPEALLTFSGEGLNGMSRNFHRVCREHLGRCAAPSLHHPIVINSWEAMYFDFDEDKMIRFIKDCAGLGIDTVVMDDGWFGHRDDDRSSLGDWFIHEKKLPNGLQGIIDACHSSGMQFGIWFEPEMISRDSRLFEQHPDWCIHVPGREPVESRSQLILDMSRPEVVDCIFRQMSEILDRYDISYIKWDMNRHMTDNGSAALHPERQGEVAHRYILGLYNLISRLETKYPEVFFEGCSGGGGRFDFGMLYYMPQIWTSDDTDAVERMKIQYGTSYVYPPSAMVAHVSACPNHQTGRTTPFQTRGEVAQCCSFGYEFDVGKLSDDEKNAIRQQIQTHRRLEALIDHGTFYRLRSPFQTDCCAWQLVSPEQDRSYVMLAWKTGAPHPKPQYLRLQGLDPKARYHIPQLNLCRSGETLMQVGLAVTMPENVDHASLTFDLMMEASPKP